MAFIPKYLHVLDTALNSTSVPTGTLATVSVYPDIAQKSYEVTQNREQQIRQAGFEKLVRAKVTSVVLTSVPETVTVLACEDVSAVKATQHGHSVVPKTRARYFLETMTVVNLRQPISPAWWRMSDVKITQSAACS